MAGYFNHPDETRLALRQHEDVHDAHARRGCGFTRAISAISMRHIPVHRRSAERSHQNQRISGVAARDRRGAGDTSFRPGRRRAGVPDATKGEAVKAWVVARAGTHQPPTSCGCSAEASWHRIKTPATVEFRDALPKTMAGKVLRRALVAEHKRAARHNGFTATTACSSPALTAAAS